MAAGTAGLSVPVDLPFMIFVGNRGSVSEDNHDWMWHFWRPLDKDAILLQLRQIARIEHIYGERVRLLRENSHLLREIFNSVCNGITVVDARQADLPLIYVNRAFEKLTGYSRHEIYGRNCRFLQNDDNDQPGLSLVRSAITDRHATQASLRNYRKDGTPFWNELYLSPILDRSGVLTHVVGIQNDVSDRVEAGLRLEHLAKERLNCQTQLQMIFDNMIEPVVVFDCENNIVHANPPAAKLTGLSDRTVSTPEVTGRFEMLLPNGELIPYSSWPSVRALHGEAVQTLEVVVRRCDTGQTRTCEVSTSPIKDGTGKIVQVVNLYRDVTETRSADEVRAMLASIVESSEDAIIGKNSFGIVTSWNNSATKIFGYTSQEMIGRTSNILLPPGSDAQADNALVHRRDEGLVDHIETQRVRKDGKWIHVSLTTSPIKDGKGRVIGSSKIARDITLRKLMEKQTHQGQKMEAIGHLTGGIAHDFNNLLGIIIGNLDLVERSITDNEVITKRVRTAHKAAARGADLTRRLLAFC